MARRLWSRLEPIHVVTYFSPEARAELSAAGYKGFWMGYFAGRAAPMGPVGAEARAHQHVDGTRKLNRARHGGF